MPDVLQCPYCDLRFPTRSDLQQHQAFDHPQVEKEEPRTSIEPARAPVEEQEEQSARPAQKRGFLSRLFKRS
jgi:Zinc finger, C2H2 type